MFKEEMLKKMIKELPLESPSNQFRTNLMQKIQSNSKASYSILKTNYLYLSLIVCFIFGIIFYVPILENKSLMAENFQFLQQIKYRFQSFNFIKSIYLSKTLIYSFYAFFFYVIIIFANFRRI